MIKAAYSEFLFFFSCMKNRDERLGSSGLHQNIIWLEMK